LFESLQVAPHPEFGYRPMVGEYEVIGGLTAPSGTAIANPNFGAGGGNQLFICNYLDKRRLTRKISLGQ
jgi:filamentous hemagglutinin